MFSPIPSFCNASLLFIPSIIIFEFVYTPYNHIFKALIFPSYCLFTPMFLYHATSLNVTFEHSLFSLVTQFFRYDKLFHIVEHCFGHFGLFSCFASKKFKWDVPVLPFHSLILKIDFVLFLLTITVCFFLVFFFFFFNIYV